MGFLQRVGTNRLKIWVESERNPNSQRNIEKENQSQGHHNVRFQVLLQSCDHQDIVVLAQKQTHRSMEQNRESRSGFISQSEKDKHYTFSFIWGI